MRFLKVIVLGTIDRLIFLMDRIAPLRLCVAPKIGSATNTDVTPDCFFSNREQLHKIAQFYVHVDTFFAL